MLIPSSSRLLYDEALALDSFGGDRLVTNLPAWVDHWPPAGVVGGQAERDVAGGEEKIKNPLEKNLAWCQTWPFTLGLDTIGHLFEGVAKNGSICPHDICGFEKAAAVVWGAAHLRSEERAGDVSGFMWALGATLHILPGPAVHSICLLFSAAQRAKPSIWCWSHLL